MFSGLTQDEVESMLSTYNFPRIHAKNMFRWFYKELKDCWQEAPTLPKKLKQILQDNFSDDPACIDKAFISNYDSSVKLIIKMQDGAKVESVLMPENKRITLCISTQVGCRQACSFCHTGRMGLIRNLQAKEIVSQVLLANKWIKKNPSWLKEPLLTNLTERRVSNIVFMGMGEPLDNVEELIQSIHIINEPYGLDLPLRRISVSTAGHLEGLRRIHKVFPNIPIAFSMHSVDHKSRSKLMPINRQFPLAEVLSYLEQHYKKGKKGVKPFIQFTLIKGINDDTKTASELIKLTKPLDPKINLIPLNPVDPSRLEAPSPDSLIKFRNMIHDAGIRVMIRYSKGQDIGGACGQLITRSET